MIFPGVGEASTAMNYLKMKGLDVLIPTLKQPFLGICLGQQLLCSFSEEGNTKCLGIFDLKVKQFPATDIVPHMGWNNITSTQPNPLLQGIEAQDFYFVHSYTAAISPHSIASCTHGSTFTAAVAYRNFYGVQFHPERSGPQGQQLLANFLSIRA